jgi:hypothetical protein
MKSRSVSILLVLGAVLALSGSAVAQQPQPAEVFNAFAVSLQAGGGAAVEIVINRWSTEGEKQLLTNVLKASGSEAMVRIMQDLPQVGYIRGNNTMGDALFYAWSTNNPDGTRQVVIATDRPISAAAMVAPGTANKYDATVIEMRFNKDGKGEGKIVVAGKAFIDPKTGKPGIQNYQGQPVRLESITSKKQ